ncbi:MAG: GNAT family N-acetyltransferase [Anaerohalosphaeraceae bacterium]
MIDSLNSRMLPLEQTAEGFETFYRAHQNHWQRQKRTGHFGDWPKSREFHAELVQTMAKLGRLRLLEVRCGSEPIGYKYAYRFGKTLVEYLDARIDQSKYERASIGNLIFLEQVKWACKEGVEVIDSLSGRYEHKLYMGGKLFPTRKLMIYRKRSWIRLNLFVLLAKLLNLIYYKIWFCRICPRWNISRRPLWKSWIRSHIFAR